MSKSSRRKSAQALAKKVWGIMVLKNKDQKKSSSSVRSNISDDTSKDDDNRLTMSVSIQDSSSHSLEPQAAGLDDFIEVSKTEEDEDESYCLLSQSVDAAESNQDVKHGQHERDDSNGEEVKETNSLPVTVLQVNLIDESVQGEGSVRAGVSKEESEHWMEVLKLNDNTPCLSQDEEDASTLTQSQGIDQQFEESKIEEDDYSCCLSQGIDPVESNQDVTEHGQHEHDDADSEEMKHTNSLPVTVLQVNLDESLQGEGSVRKGVRGKVESEDWLETMTLEDKTSSPSRDEEVARTSTQSQGIAQHLCLEEANEENAFVEGATVHIIKGTNRGKCGIISRVTSKCVFISISGFDKDVRKTKSNEFLKIAYHKEINNTHYDSDPQEQEDFVEGNLVRIKKGVHKNCDGIISRVTEKCVYVSIRGLSKDVGKKKSTEFLELLNDGVDCAPQDVDEQASSAESSEVNVFVVGKRVMIMKGTHVGECGVISRVTNKSAYVSIENMPKDIRKTKSDQFLQIVNPVHQNSLK